ncbi:MAG TPA: class I SAM-dependent methyltransferase [Patescibacteria group bacterium]|jgi:SAM-dependent methyltransferase|nr:class I SAM-dependent methyltransferase [Patescibacteria group bacterium]
MSYQDIDIAKDYIAFTNSIDGKIQQEVVFKAISKNLDVAVGATILDVACGGGWLANKLSGKYAAFGCDFSPELIRHAKSQAEVLAGTQNSSAKFEIADTTDVLPYSDEQFDASIFNMSAHDVSNLEKTFAEISRVTKSGGKILMTVANPYYAFPVGIWKRGWLGFLLRRKPQLLVRPFFEFKRKPRQFTWNGKFTSYFYTLPEYIKNARAAGLQLSAMEDLESGTDDENYSRRYQLFRFPVMQLLVFEKGRK